MQCTDRQRMFVEEYVRTGKRTDSYQKVYGCTFSAAKGSAGKMLQKPHVASYVDELRGTVQDIAQDIVVDKKKVLGNLNELRLVGLQEKQLGPAVRATELMGKEIGMFRDKVDHIHTVSDEALVLALSQHDPELAKEAARALEV